MVKKELSKRVLAVIYRIYKTLGRYFLAQRNTFYLKKILNYKQTKFSKYQETLRVFIIKKLMYVCLFLQMLI